MQTCLPSSVTLDLASVSKLRPIPRPLKKASKQRSTVQRSTQDEQYLRLNILSLTSTNILIEHHLIDQLCQTSESISLSTTLSFINKTATSQTTNSNHFLQPVHHLTTKPVQSILIHQVVAKQSSSSVRFSPRCFSTCESMHPTSRPTN